jgi:3-hydroxyisobutyrate dehydrogenase-like beta-hydroxyacid dehydrogenase
VHGTGEEPESNVEEDNRAVGLVGLGLMGTAMSTRLLEAGYEVLGFDVDEARRSEHSGRGGTVAADVAELATRCRTIILSLPHADISREVCLGETGVAVRSRQGTVVADTTTTRPDDAVALGRELTGRGLQFLDVGISGNSARVREGEALGVVGGAAEQAPVLLDALATFCSDVMVAGDVGDGMRAKLTINHVLTLNRFALAEGLVFAETLGMQPHLALDALRRSAAYSTAIDMWGTRMVEEDYDSPASRVRGGNKDLQLILQLAKEQGSPTFALGQVDNVVRAMLANGLGDLDNAVLADMLRRMAGIRERREVTSR